MDVRRALNLARRTTAVAVVMAVLACTTHSDDRTPSLQTPSATTPTSPSADLGLRTGVGPLADQEDVIAAVTSAGIRVVGADGSTAYGAVAPASGIEIGEEELAGLVAQGEAGSGTVGATLDALFDTEIPMSAFLAGYARGADTPAAHLAADLLEGQDLTHPDQVVFPALVSMVFAADLAHAAGAPDAV